MGDKLLKRFILDRRDRTVQDNAERYIKSIRPQAHKGQIVVVVYEHVELVTKAQRGSYMAELNRQASRYRQLIQALSDWSGYSPDEMCKIVNQKADGKLFDTLPTGGDFHQRMKDLYNGGATTTTMQKGPFSKYSDNALREATHLVDKFDLFVRETVK